MQRIALEEHVILDRPEHVERWITMMAWAGAQLAMDRLHFFLPDMTSGRGFIGLTAALFGAARPGPTGGAAFLFGAFGVIGDRLQLLQAPSQFVLMAPYLAALLALVFARWRAQARARPAPVRENPVHETAP